MGGRLRVQHSTAELPRSTKEKVTTHSLNGFAEYVKQNLLQTYDVCLQIVYVTPEGLSSRQGLPSKAMTLEGDDFCNWWITEINHRPLNLSFKNDEVGSSQSLQLSCMVARSQ